MGTETAQHGWVHQVWVGEEQADLGQPFSLLPDSHTVYFLAKEWGWGVHESLIIRANESAGVYGYTPPHTNTLPLATPAALGSLMAEGQLWGGLSRMTGERRRNQVATQGLHQGPLMSTPPPRAKPAGAIFIYLRKLQLLSNTYFKVPFLFVIKKERFLSEQPRVRLARSELLQTQLDLRLGLLLCVVLPGSSSPLTPRTRVHEGSSEVL